jgi:galactokinase
MANDVVARAPGRVNLIGDHTDYNDGFVLPMALPFETIISATPRTDNEVHLISPGYGTASFSLTDDPSIVASWARYVAGMAHLLTREGIETSGFDASIATDIPIGAGLSSSAAFEVAAGYAITGLAGIEPDPANIARLGQRVENEFIGIQSGIMDQLISAGASAGGPTLIDCRSLALTPIELPHAAQVIIMDTMTRRDLYDVSAPSLDAMVTIADAQPGCFGARMTGGGFAGCAVALVKRDDVTDFLRNVELDYLSETGLAPDLWAVDPSPGASVTFGAGVG